MTVGNSEFTLEDSVNIVGGDLADTYAFELLKNMLTEFGIKLMNQKLRGYYYLYRRER